MRPFFETVVEAIRTSAAARRAVVQQARSEARAALARHRHERRAVAARVRHSLREHRAAALAAVRAAVAPVRTASSASTRPMGNATPTQAERAGVWELWPAATEADRPDRLENEVLRIIEDHPEGVRALDVGNELGVDWRRVLGATHDLVDAGKVDQIDHEFYPVGASRRW